MKTNQIFRSVIAMIVLFVAGASSFAGQKTAEISISTVQCGTCSKTIKKALNKIDGVITVDVDIKNKKATITYNDSKITLEQIENTITRAGYDANDKKADPSAYQELDDCCKLPKDQKEKSGH